MSSRLILVCGFCKNKYGIETCIKIQEKEAEKDLGVFVYNSLPFKHHVEQAKLKANRVMGLIRRSFDYLSEEMFVQLFKGLVRPILEYGHSIWNLDIATCPCVLRSFDASFSSGRSVW